VPARRFPVKVTEPETITNNINEAKREREDRLMAMRAVKVRVPPPRASSRPLTHARCRLAAVYLSFRARFHCARGDGRGCLR
jgi:hypothetical protein